jgi:glycosyltransferase involved in cell wall biosynthesis
VAELISVIVTTYDRVDALDAVLRSLSRQADRDFEVVIADDGSGPETAALLDAWKGRLGVPLKQVWHEHRDFRAGEIRNRGIRASAGRYCIFLDGDCITRPDFVMQHRALAAPGWLVTGNRVLLTEQLTSKILAEKLEPEQWSAGEWIGQRFSGGLNRLAPVLHLPLGLLRRLTAGRWQGARSCNLAIWRADLDRVDGFDAIFSGWGKEDSDLVIRLLNAGIRRKDGRYATGVLHLWHPASDRTRLAENERLLAEVIESERIRAERGMSALNNGDGR